MKKIKAYLSVDVEASGQVSGLYDIISAGLVVIEPGLSRSFYGEFAPLHDAYQQSAYDAIGVTREQHLAMPDARETTLKMVEWLDNLKADRIVVVTDNPGFDFQFLSWCCWRFVDRSPLGHSARRIGDFSAGLKRDWMETNGWKKLRRTSHTHNALDDAMGNAEAVMALFEKHDLKAPWDAK